MTILSQIINVIFISTLFLFLAPFQTSHLLGVTRDALSPWAGLLLIFSASYLFLRVLKQVYIFFAYRKARRAVWSEFEEEAITQEKIKGRKPEAEEEEEMDLLNT